MRDTQRKGDTATTQAIASFTRLGYDVSIPVTESAAYDLIVDAGGTLLRVQCKYSGSSSHEVGLRRIHSNSGGYVSKKYAAGSFDALYVLRSDGEEFLIVEDLSGRSSIRVNKSEHHISNHEEITMPYKQALTPVEGL